MLFIATVFMTSCSVGPKYADSPQMKGEIVQDVNTMMIYFFTHPKPDTEFVDAIRTGAINIDGLTNDAISEDCLELFCTKYYTRAYGDDVVESFMSDIEKYTYLSAKSNTQRSRDILTRMENEYLTFFSQWVDKNVKIINWDYDEDSLADTYTGYLVEYEIGEGFYVLVRLIEYDNSDRYSYETIYSGYSLTELHECYG